MVSVLVLALMDIMQILKDLDAKNVIEIVRLASGQIKIIVNLVEHHSTTKDPHFNVSVNAIKTSMQLIPLIHVKVAIPIAQLVVVL